MQTSIKITGLQTYGYHGLFEEERTLGQKFSFDISATLREVRTHLSDDLDSSVRYDAVVDEAVQIAASAKFQTLEALGETIAANLLRSKIQPADCALYKTGRRPGQAAPRRAFATPERDRWRLTASSSACYATDGDEERRNHGLDHSAIQSCRRAASQAAHRVCVA